MMHAGQTPPPIQGYNNTFSCLTIISFFHLPLLRLNSTVAALSFPGVKGYFTPLSVVFRNCPLSLDILLPTNECHYDDIREVIQLLQELVNLLALVPPDLVFLKILWFNDPCSFHHDRSSFPKIPFHYNICQRFSIVWKFSFLKL